MARLLLLAPLLLVALAPRCQVPHCVDPLATLDGAVDPGSLSAVRAACPVCPWTEQARYADGSDYFACVSAAAASLPDETTIALRALVGSAWVAAGEPARTLLPGPGENGYDPDLATLATAYDRQFFTFNAAPFGAPQT